MVNGTNLTLKPIEGSGVGGGGTIMGAETVSTMSLWWVGGGGCGK